MSDNIPFEIQVEIIKKIPDVKLLIQLRSVSKPWKYVIDSPKFIADYHTCHHNHRLLVRYTDSPERIDKYVLIDDDDSFPKQKIPMIVPMYVKLLTNVPEEIITTISQGLVCLYNGSPSPSDSVTKTVVLWNPAIRKSVDIVVPNFLKNNRYNTAIGFGVSPHTNDPMLVKITNIGRTRHNTINCIPRHVEVFTLSTGVWRSLCTDMPRISVEFSWDNIVIDRFIYWLVIDWCDVDGFHRVRNMIMSFDMTNEKFTEISLPDYLARFIYYCLSISKLRDSLVVLETDKHAEKQEHVVWIMEDCVPNSFRKLFTIKTLNGSVFRVVGFRKSGEPIIRRSVNLGEELVFSLYDPCTQCFNDIVIYEDACLFSVSSYTETLLLLDH